MPEGTPVRLRTAFPSVTATPFATGYAAAPFFKVAFTVPLVTFVAVKVIVGELPACQTIGVPGVRLMMILGLVPPPVQ